MSRQLFFRRPFKYVYFKATLIIILLNFAAFAFCALNTTYNWTAIFSLNIVCVNYYHMFWQFFTYMFMHGSFSHIFFNMLGLLMFGLNLERAIGSREFLLFYFFCGLLSGLLSYVTYLATNQYNAFLLGASGALYAVLFAYAVFFPRSVIYIWGLIPVPAPILVLIYAAIEIFDQVFERRQGVAHLTHLFGFLAAWLYFVIRMGIHPIKIWKNEYKK